LNNRIKELRKARGMSQKELAVKVGVRRETIAYLESGSYSPSLELAYSIARIFQLTLEEIFYFDQMEG
jgi:putative transcriptional regulator